MDLFTLETLGYTVIPNFLNSEELAQMISLYEKSRNPTAPNPELLVYGNEPHKLEEKINNLLLQINSSTNIKSDRCGKGTLFLDVNINYKWHQDHESYYFYQSAYDVLIIWIPLIKPNSKISGLSVIPYDRLEKTNSLSLFKNKGAQRIVKFNDVYKLTNDDNGEVHDIDFAPDDLSIDIECSPGDAVILRGDTLHKTQDQIDKRLAVSIRCFQSTGLLTKKKFDITCEYKQQLIAKSLFFKTMAEKFQERSEFTIEDILSFNLSR